MIRKVARKQTGISCIWSQLPLYLTGISRIFLIDRVQLKVISMFDCRHWVVVGARAGLLLLEMLMETLHMSNSDIKKGIKLHLHMDHMLLFGAMRLSGWFSVVNDVNSWELVQLQHELEPREPKGSFASFIPTMPINGKAFPDFSGHPKRL
ncbi:hypothetical protein HHK36_027303 [Tetracentron sinense]|uniref:Uncharacterized protein n=1 Tax=Tetracentron sinense TaxID=13715 RepID=A0A834YMX1_TETSI|nr:hypothetical protein HHK36_027303 [Tetracentron sinense]